MYARLAELRSRRSELAGKIKNLEIARGALVAGSGASGIAGIAIGTTEAAVSVRLSVVQSQYDEVARNIDALEAEMADILRRVERWNNWLRESGHEMNQLNCVSDT